MKAEIKLPRYVIKKIDRNGRNVYYFNVPTWARKRAIETGDEVPVHNEVLGSDIMSVIEKANLLNGILDSWREGEKVERIEEDSIDHLVQWYKCHPKFLCMKEGTQKDYGRALNFISTVFMPSAKNRLGLAPASALQMKHADILYDIAKVNKEGKTVLRTANLFMIVYRRMWGLALRAGKFNLTVNPFEKMGLETRDPVGARPATYEELLIYIKAADALNLPEVGDAALIAFEFLQRVQHIIGVLAWSDYIPGKQIRIEHPKTGARVDFPLYFKGETLFPEFEKRMAERTRRDGLIVMLKRKKTGKIQQYERAWFHKTHVKVREYAGLPEDLKFSSFRKGGFTVLGNSGATDSEIMASGGHKQRQTISVYTKKTAEQIVSAVRKKRAYLFGDIGDGSDEE